MEMQTGKTLASNMVNAWHDQLMPLRTTLEMLIAVETKTVKESRMQVVIELVHARLHGIIAEMDEAHCALYKTEQAAPTGESPIDHDIASRIRENFPKDEKLHLHPNHVTPTPGEACTQPREMSFTSVGRALYQLRPDAHQNDVISHLSARLSQLNAMLHQTYGCGGETFRNWNDHIQDDYLWGCQMATKECLDLVENLPPK